LPQFKMTEGHKRRPNPKLWMEPKRVIQRKEFLNQIHRRVHERAMAIRFGGAACTSEFQLEQLGIEVAMGRMAVDNPMVVESLRMVLDAGVITPGFLFLVQSAFDGALHVSDDTQLLAQLHRNPGLLGILVANMSNTNDMPDGKPAYLHVIETLKQVASTPGCADEMQRLGVGDAVLLALETRPCDPPAAYLIMLLEDMLSRTPRLELFHTWVPRLMVLAGRKDLCGLALPATALHVLGRMCFAGTGRPEVAAVMGDLHVVRLLLHLCAAEPWCGDQDIVQAGLYALGEFALVAPEFVCRAGVADGLSKAWDSWPAAQTQVLYILSVLVERAPLEGLRVLYGSEHLKRAVQSTALDKHKEDHTRFFARQVVQDCLPSSTWALMPPGASEELIRAAADNGTVETMLWLLREPDCEEGEACAEALRCAVGIVPSLAVRFPQLTTYPAVLAPASDRLSFASGMDDDADT